MDPLAPRIATVLSRLLTANTDPFSPTAGFCCSSAWSGTVNSPPAKPNSSSAAAGQRIRRHRPEQRKRAQAPCRTTRTAPGPVPPCRPTTAPPPGFRHRRRRPGTRSSPRFAPSVRPMTCRPAASTAICNSAPRNQNHATPSAVIHSVRSLARRCTPMARPAHGIPAQGRSVACRRDAGNADTDDCADDRDSRQRQPDGRQALVPQRVERSASGRAEDDRGKRAHLEQAVGARQRAFVHESRGRSRTWPG